jgi:hypothetical protein
MYTGYDLVRHTKLIVESIDVDEGGDYDKENMYELTSVVSRNLETLVQASGAHVHVL